MNTAKWIIGILAAAALSYFILVDHGIFPGQHNQTDSATENSNENVSVKKRYADDGSLKSDVEIVDGKRNGVAHNYYADGSVHSEIHYKNNKKHGESTWFYQDGKKYRVTLFVDGKKHGIQKKYYKNGKLMAEVPYLNNILQPGTKEYTETGKLIVPDYKFQYNIVNKTATNGLILIEISGKYVNDVTGINAFLKSDNKQLKSDRDSRTIRIHVPIKKGDNVKQTVVIWLTSKTKMNNPVIIDKEITVDPANL